MLSGAELDRYARQIILPAFGGAGQARLKAAHIAVIGAGGIGCPAITYLAAAGIGRLTIIDDDVIELSNLQRQPLFADADIGVPKADVAARAAHRINPHVHIVAVAERLTDANAAALLTGATLILDGCDNFATRLAVNAAAVRLKIPLVSAAIGAFEGQVALYEGWRADAPCYACLVGTDPNQAGVNCAEAGVMGALAGMVGTMAALETVRHIAAMAHPLTGRLILLDMLDRRWREMRVAKDPGVPDMPGLSIIVAVADGRRFYAALEAAMAAAALGRPARVFLQGDAAILLRDPVGFDGDGARQAAGQPDLAGLVSEALAMEVALFVCQSGMALVSMTADTLVPNVRPAGLVSFLADIRPDDHLLVY